MAPATRQPGVLTGKLAIGRHQVHVCTANSAGPGTTTFRWRVYDIDGFLTSKADVRAVDRSWQAATLPHPRLTVEECYLYRQCTAFSLGGSRQYGITCTVLAGPTPPWGLASVKCSTRARPEHDHRGIAAITVRLLCPRLRIAGYR